MSEKNLYEILGIRPGATQADIRAAYLKLAKQWHPDRNPGNETEAERRFKEIAHAYDVLSDPDKRASYDASGAANYQSSGFESSMDDAAAFDLFISVLLDLAFELAETGADQITIYQALIEMGCPSGTAKNLAQKAHRLGGNAKKSTHREGASKSAPKRNGGGGGSNGGTETADVASNAQDDPRTTFPAGAWSRWFARSLDLLVGAAVASPIIGWLFQWLWTIEQIPFRLAAYVFVISPIPLIADAIIVGIFGNSLGKALLKIRVMKKASAGGMEDLRPISFEDVGSRNFQIWLKGYWCSIPVLAAIPQFLAYLKVSEGKQVPWDLGPDYQGLSPSDIDVLSRRSIQDKQKFIVVRQKTRWELIAAFVVCAIVASIAARVGSQLLGTPLPVLTANEAATNPEVPASDAADATASNPAIPAAPQSSSAATATIPDDVAENMMAGFRDGRIEPATAEIKNANGATYLKIEQVREVGHSRVLFFCGDRNIHILAGIVTDPEQSNFHASISQRSYIELDGEEYLVMGANAARAQGSVMWVERQLDDPTIRAMLQASQLDIWTEGGGALRWGGNLDLKSVRPTLRQFITDCQGA